MVRRLIPSSVLARCLTYVWSVHELVITTWFNLFQPHCLHNEQPKASCKSMLQPTPHRQFRPAWERNWSKPQRPGPLRYSGKSQKSPALGPLPQPQRPLSSSFASGDELSLHGENTAIRNTQDVLEPRADKRQSASIKEWKQELEATKTAHRVIVSNLTSEISNLAGDKRKLEARIRSWDRSEVTCVVCLDRAAEYAISHCGHLCLCIGRCTSVVSLIQRARVASRNVLCAR